MDTSGKEKETITFHEKNISMVIPVSLIEFNHKHAHDQWQCAAVGQSDPAGQSEFFVRDLRLKTFN